MDPANGYVEDDTVVFEIDLKVDEPEPLWDFDERSSVKAKSSECSICLHGIVDRAPAVALANIKSARIATEKLNWKMLGPSSFESRRNEEFFFAKIVKLFK